MNVHFIKIWSFFYNCFLATLSYMNKLFKVWFTTKKKRKEGELCGESFTCYKTANRGYRFVGLDSFDWVLV